MQVLFLSLCLVLCLALSTSSAIANQTTLNLLGLAVAPTNPLVQNEQIAPSLSVYSKSAIYGAWDSTDLNCPERYVFGKNDILMLYSGAEITKTQFEFLPGVPFSALLIAANKPNGAPDCAGKIANENPEAALLLRLDDVKKPTVMQFCASPDECQMTLKKVLP